MRWWRNARTGLRFTLRLSSPLSLPAPGQRTRYLSLWKNSHISFNSLLRQMRFLTYFVCSPIYFNIQVRSADYDNDDELNINVTSLWVFNKCGKWLSQGFTAFRQIRNGNIQSYGNLIQFKTAIKISIFIFKRGPKLISWFKDLEGDLFYSTN